MITGIFFKKEEELQTKMQYLKNRGFTVHRPAKVFDLVVDAEGNKIKAQIGWWISYESK